MEDFANIWIIIRVGQNESIVYGECMARLQDLDRIYSSCGFPAEKLQFWGRSALYQSKTLAISAGVIVSSRLIDYDLDIS